MNKWLTPKDFKHSFEIETLINLARHVWVTAYSDKTRDDLYDFVDQLGGKWWNFIGKKIDGYDDEGIRT